ncbi:class II fructose-bisphosphate aldolase [Candidatus Woesearchaeota archaeon]|nr:MAG: class II fructose-bisphosphate aldolase [Candidatus Woesearchaeota archaeon]
MKASKRLFIRGLFQKARKEAFAIGAFNFSDSVTARGIAVAAAKMRAPVILSTSEGEAGVITPQVARGVVDGLSTLHKMPFILHLDHGKSLEMVKEAIKAGYDSVHIDGSALPYKENVSLTRKVVRYAHARGVFVEGELGHIGGGSTLHKKRTYKDVLKNAVLTDPDLAAQFVRATGVDSLAVNVGNVHGVWKGEPHIDVPRLRSIVEKTGVFVVLHGGSGIPARQVRSAIRVGIDKVNINSEMRIAYTSALRGALRDRSLFVPREYLPLAQKAVEGVVRKKLELFMSKGKVGKSARVVPRGFERMRGGE